MKYNRKIISIGNSNGLIIPSDVLEYLNIHEGTEIVIQIEEGKKGKYISIWKNK